MEKQVWLATAGIHGFLGVAAGAFGAHGLEGRLDAKALSWWHKAADYQMWHALALFGCAMLALHGGQKLASRAGLAFNVGILLFSGSLYVMALTGVTALGAVTPFGGTAFLIGWGLLAWGSARGK